MEDSFKSKTQLKKEADDIQGIGLEISRLSVNSIQKLSLSKEIKEAIIFYQSIKKNSAKRRQAQYIGKILRSIDLSDVNKELELIKNISRLRVKAEHESEKWRNQLIEDPKKIDAFINQFKNTPDNFNQTIVQARKEFLADKKGKNFRNLFRIIISIIENSK